MRMDDGDAALLEKCKWLLEHDHLNELSGKTYERFPAPVFDPIKRATPVKSAAAFEPQQSAAGDSEEDGTPGEKRSGSRSEIDSEFKRLFFDGEEREWVALDQKFLPLHDGPVDHRRTLLASSLCDRAPRPTASEASAPAPGSTRLSAPQPQPQPQPQPGARAAGTLGKPRLASELRRPAWEERVRASVGEVPSIHSCMDHAASHPRGFQSARVRAAVRPLLDFLSLGPGPHAPAAPPAPAAQGGKDASPSGIPAGFWAPRPAAERQAEAARCAARAEAARRFDAGLASQRAAHAPRADRKTTVLRSPADPPAPAPRPAAPASARARSGGGSAGAWKGAALEEGARPEAGRGEGDELVFSLLRGGFRHADGSPGWGGVALL